jgi:hypothetical protein
MPIVPRSRQQWLSLATYPFKVYTAFAYIALRVWSGYLPPRGDYADAGAMVMLGYLLCFGALCIGATVQMSLGPRRDHLTTWAFAAADLLFVVLMLPYLAHT